MSRGKGDIDYKMYILFERCTNEEQYRNFYIYETKNQIE